MKRILLCSVLILIICFLWYLSPIEREKIQTIYNKKTKIEYEISLLKSNATSNQFIQVLRKSFFKRTENLANFENYIDGKFIEFSNDSTMKLVVSKINLRVMKHDTVLISLNRNWHGRRIHN